MKRVLSLLLSMIILLSASASFAADPVAVQSISMNMTEASIPVKQKLTLKASVEPGNATNKKLDWTSSDEGVATVNNGQVTGVSPGTAVITASAADGSGISASVTVTVVNPVTKILPQEKQLTLPAGVSWEMFWSVEPADATNKNVVWTGNNEKVATVTENGIVFTHQNGYCTLTGSAADGSGVKTVVNLTVKNHEILILKPGAVDVDFETENTTVTEEQIVKGKSTTIKLNRYFTTENGCVTSTEDMVLMPVKAGSDTISIQFINSKKKTERIDKHTVFVARSAVGEAAEYTEDGTVKPIRFLHLKWGSAYPDIRTKLESRGMTVKNIAQNNDNLRAMIDGEVLFASLTAFKAALNFTYDHNSRLYEVKNSLFKGDLYFDVSIPYEDVVSAVKDVYMLEEGEASGDVTLWERDHISVVLTKKERFTLLELIWDGEPLPAVAEEEEDDDPDEDETKGAGSKDEEAAEEETGMIGPAVQESEPEGPWDEDTGDSWPGDVGPGSDGDTGEDDSWSNGPGEN